jgi:hypothetical protein
MPEHIKMNRDEACISFDSFKFRYLRPDNPSGVGSKFTNGTLGKTPEWPFMFGFEI